MKVKVIFEDLKTIDYKEAWDYQEVVFKKLIDLKAENRDLPDNKQKDIQSRVLFCEHPHVYTLGKSGEQNNLLINDDFLRKINARYYKINRGGDITYHGPGQIVAYPIIDLEKFNLQVKQYIAKLEDSIILTLKEYNIESGRIDSATGVWIAGESKNPRKICAIGVKVSRFITMHGFAFNINTNLDYFNYINPCGFVDKGVTSLEKELGRKVDIEDVKNKLKFNIQKVFGMNFVE